MVIDRKKGLIDSLNLENVRYRDFYAKILRERIDRGRGIDSSYSGMLRYLESFNKDQIKDLVFSLVDARKEKILSEEEFDWIKQEGRACNFVWCLLKWATFDNIKALSHMGQESETPGYRYLSTSFFDQYVRAEDFHDFDKNYQQLIEFFDGWGGDIYFKRNMMNSLKGCWENKKREKVKLAWLEKDNEEQCEWVWEYIKRKFERHFIIGKVFIVLRPLSSSQYYACSFAVLDFWEAAAGEKQYFAMKLKKAWDQREYRKKQVGRSPLNTYISSEAKIKLDKLAEEREEKIYRTLERIIRKAYEDSR